MDVVATVQIIWKNKFSYLVVSYRQLKELSCSNKSEPKKHNFVI